MKNNSVHFQMGSAEQYTLWNEIFRSVTEVNEALLRAQEGQLLIRSSPLLTPCSLVLPRVTDGSADQMDLKTSWRPGNSYSWLPLCITAPQYLL